MTLSLELKRPPEPQPRLDLAGPASLDRLDTAACNIVWFKEFPNGRFANAAFQFLFAKYVEKKLGCTVWLGDQPHRNSILPSLLFGLPGQPDIPDAAREAATRFGPLTLAEERKAGPAPDTARIERHFQAHPASVLVVDGFFQYDTAFVKSDPCYMAAFDEWFCAGAEPGRTPFQSILKTYLLPLRQMVQGGHLIALHVRRGDYLLFNRQAGAGNGTWTYTVDLNACVTQVLNFISVNRIAKPFIYVASDDLDYCIDHFAARSLNVITRRDLLQSDSRSEVTELMVDIAALAAADAVLASNSSLSILSCLLNRDGRVFMRQAPDGSFVSFDPWATSVLLGL